MVSDDEDPNTDSLEARIPQFDGPIDEKPAGKQTWFYLFFFCKAKASILILFIYF